MSFFITCFISFSGLLDADWEQQIRDRGAEREWGGAAGEKDGGGRCGLPWLPTATSLSLTASSPTLSPSTSPSPSPPGQRGSRRREGEVVAADAAEAVSGARGASFIPLPSLPLFYSSAQAPTEEAAGCGGLHRREAPFPGCCPSPGPFPRSGYTVSPMEPLPTQGQTLRHYTASRPRPRRTHTQPPSSRPQVRTHMPKTAQTTTHAHTYCEDAYRAIHIEEFQCRTDPFLFTHRLRTVHGLYKGLECMVINYSHSRK